MISEKLNNLRHSAAHLLAAAVMDLYPGTKITIGPVIENGFYYDFDFPKNISEEDLPKIELRMKELVKEWEKFEKKEVSAAEARKIFTENEYKIELIDELVEKGEKISLYQSGNFVDLCRGGHMEDPKENLKYFKLLSLAGAYWRGDEKNKMLTRIYGTAFETKLELDEYLVKLEEAKKRDHRRLGQEMELFLVDPKVGMGLVLWQPKGALIWRMVEDFWYQEHLKNGYELVRTPHIGSRELWETSGHWGFYNESMYPPLEVGQTLKEAQEGNKAKVKEEYLLKPMNCPFHVSIYNSRSRSYRELPLRWAECGTVYRYEKSGELSGLTRVRGFTQDDAHIICTREQAKSELKRVTDFIAYMLKTFGFEDFKVYLSLRDPANKEKYVGGDEGWDFTQKILEEVAIEQKLDYQTEEGEAAFYGPKLDYKIKDCLGRGWQCSTLQFDFNLPERFDMTFVNKNGEKERPIVLHRALFGSFERFLGLLIEQYAGSLPVWLSPVQVKILPVSDKTADYAKEVKQVLLEVGVRVELDDESESLGKKIRKAETEKIPYMLIVGEKEANTSSVSVRARGEKDLGTESLEKFIHKIKVEIESKK